MQFVSSQIKSLEIPHRVPGALCLEHMVRDIYRPSHLDDHSLFGGPMSSRLSFDQDFEKLN